MEFLRFVAVSVGAILGAWFRWWLSHCSNPVFPTLPLGTLAANLIGAFFVGVAIAFFNKHPGLHPEGKLLVITGFMGGLTTFSTFSTEAVTLIGREQYGWAAGQISVHLFGSLILTGLGMYTIKLLAGT